MKTNLWAHVRRLFNKRMPSHGLEQVLAGWRAEEPRAISRSAEKREMLHPLKGWVMDSPERAPNEENLRGMARHPAHGRTRVR